MAQPYVTLFDAATAPVPVAPIVAVPFVFMLVVLVCIGHWLKYGRYPRRTRTILVVLGLIYPPALGHGYWNFFEQRDAAKVVDGLLVAEGRISDFWFKEKTHGKSVDYYQHFWVDGVEFLDRHKKPAFSDFLLPRLAMPALPLKDGLAARVTYREEGHSRVIVKVEAAIESNTASTSDGG